MERENPKQEHVWGKIKCGVLASGDGSLSSSAAVSDMTPPTFDHNERYVASEVSASSEQFDITSSNVHDHFKVGENVSSIDASTPSENSSASGCGRGRARTRGCARGVRIRGGMRGIYGIRTGIGPRTRGGRRGACTEFGSCSTFEDVPSDAIDLAAVKLTVSNAVTDADVVNENTTVPDEEEGWSNNPPTVSCKYGKYGIKFFELCTHDGFILRVPIYGGKSIEENDLGKTVGVVIHLVNDFLDKGYSLFTDSY